MCEGRLVFQRLSLVAVGIVSAISMSAYAQGPPSQSPLSSEDQNVRFLIAYSDHIIVRPASPTVDIKLERRDFRSCMSYLRRVSNGGGFEQLELLYSSRVCGLWTSVEGYGVIRYEERVVPVRSDLKVDLARWKAADKKVKGRSIIVSVPGGFAKGNYETAQPPDTDFEPMARVLWDWNDAVRGFVNISGRDLSEEEIEEFAKRIKEVTGEP